MDDTDQKTALETLKKYNAAVRIDIAFNPNVKDGRRTEGLEVNKSNWANTLDTPPFEAYAVTCGITFSFGGLKVMPQVTAYASKGGVSSVLAQLLLFTSRPSVRRPSFTFGLNAMSMRTAALYFLRVSSAVFWSVSSMRETSSSSVLPLIFVTCLMRYSSRSCGFTLASKICHANCLGCCRITRPYFA